MRRTRTRLAVCLSQEARRQARLRFGNPRATRERVWRYRSLPMVEDGWRDLRFAVRSLARTPGFTVIALLVIAVGIGVNTAVFSVVNAVLLKPLTYPDPQALVQLVTTSDRGPFPVASIPEYNIWQQQSAIFQQVAAYDLGGAGIEPHGRRPSRAGTRRPCYPRILPAVRRSRRCRTHVHRSRRQSTWRSRCRVELRSVEEALRREPKHRRLHHPDRRPAVAGCRHHRPQLRHRYARGSVDTVSVRPDFAGDGPQLQCGSAAEAGRHRRCRRMRSSRWPRTSSGAPTAATRCHPTAGSESCRCRSL